MVHLFRAVDIMHKDKYKDKEREEERLYKKRRENSTFNTWIELMW